MTAHGLPEADTLSVTGLCYSYPGRHVYTGWSAAFAPGLTWLRGSNGSGKSTLLKLLAGVLPPLAGGLRLRGIEAVADPLAWRRAVFWCGPGTIAFDHLRPPEFFGFLAGLYPQMSTEALQAHVAALGLQPYMSRRIAELSTGTQRKVWLAAALSAGTAVVLLDEPLNALDAAALAHMRQQLALAAQGTADGGRIWIVASHEAPVTVKAMVSIIDLGDPAGSTETGH